MTKQRIRDPIHGLVTFESDADEVVWALLNTREFQRLRRIKQLGFSEFVYPGATHSRFAHSVGVFHNAKIMLRLIEKQIPEGEWSQRKSLAALCAALLHDVGHGPFSHTFEGVLKALKRKKSHESWSVETVEEDTEINRILTKMVDERFPKEVASVIKEKEPSDIYSSIVSSQFDADRLDYLVRDRYMTGVDVGHFDFDWLLDCINVSEIYLDAQDDDDVVSAPGLVLNHKGFKAAEGYLQARYQLYSTVYLHKTTRAAEKMLGALLLHTANIINERGISYFAELGYDPVLEFLKDENLELFSYLNLDDYSVWALIGKLAKFSGDEWLSNMATRILRRDLYKCIDLGALLGDNSGDLKNKLKLTLKGEAGDMGLTWRFTLIEDDPSLTGYTWYSWDEDSALKKVLIQDRERSENIDIGNRSDLIKALKNERFYRIYVPSEEAKKRVWQRCREIANV